jgi:hypothetical protein
MTLYVARVQAKGSPQPHHPLFLSLDLIDASDVQQLHLQLEHRVIS